MTDLIVQIAIVVVPLLAAIVFHEVAHGVVAYGLGDPTAARAGRLTLNPIPHVDPVGTLLVPAVLLLAPLVTGGRPFVFGWARPVPVDFRRLGHPRRDTVLVALAGPGTNFVLAALSALVFVWLPDTAVLGTLRNMAAASLAINCVLGVFNLLPVPPLDGGRLLTALLPVESARALNRLGGLGFMVVLLLVLNTDIVPALVRPLMAFFLRLAG